MKKILLVLVSLTLKAFSAEPSITDAVAPEGRLNPWRFQAGVLALGSLDSDGAFIGTGIVASAQRRVRENSPFFVGVESGLIDADDLAMSKTYAFLFPNQGTKDVVTDSVRTVPVLATALIREDEGNFHWYSGVAVGPTFQTITAKSNKTGEHRTQTEMGAMAIFRAGADIDLTGSTALSLELLRFGLFQQAFAYMPSIALSASF